MAFRRKKMNRRKSRRLFTGTAKRVHKYNVQGRPKRGGIRL